MRRFSLLLLVFGLVAAEQHIPDDVIPNYSHVKDLLRQSSIRDANSLGLNFDPTSINQIGVQMKDDGTEAYVNREILNEVFETDIILNPEQAEALLNQRNPPIRGKRQLASALHRYWKELTVPFSFQAKNGVKNEKTRQLIREVLRYLETELCFRFKENGTGDGLNYIHSNGCWSLVGRQGGMQPISMGDGCDDFSIIAHETLHAFGVWHEQSRNDRDEHIFINEKTIAPGGHHNFGKRFATDEDNYGMPYDLGSVMHYSTYSYTLDQRQKTITTLDPNYQNTIGSRGKPTFRDMKLVNARYCSNICKVKLPCANDGYTDPNNCSKCRCPSGYSGKLCDQLEKTSCGGELVANGKWQNLQTNMVKANDNCMWRIKAPAGQKIEAIFDRVHFPCPNEVCESYVEYKFHESKAETGAHLCCKPPAKPIISGNNEVLVFLKGFHRLQKGYTGFSLRYRTIGTPLPPPPTSKPTTTRRTTTTTPRPTTTLPKGPTGTWGNWGSWSECTKPCGGCGTQKRLRTCNGGNKKCQGPSTQTQSCNQQVCKKTTQTCKGRLLIPCELLPKLRFTEQSVLPDPPSRWSDQVRRDIASSLRGTQFYRSPISRDKFRRRFKRQLEHPMCEKTFSYSCPTELLTINIDWRTARMNNDVINMDEEDDVMECCVGYKASGGKCYKIYTRRLYI